jgi:hypothetical protein
VAVVPELVARAPVARVPVEPEARAPEAEAPGAVEQEAVELELVAPAAEVLEAAAPVPVARPVEPASKSVGARKSPAGWSVSSPVSGDAPDACG